MKFPLAAAAFALLALPVQAEFIKVASTKSVTETLDALKEAVVGAGADIFAQVDHNAAAASIDLPLLPSQLLIFGNPAFGTPAMQDDPRAGVLLPLRVLVYEDDGGKVWLSYQSIDAMFEGLEIPAYADYRARMAGALKTLTAKAAE